MILLTWRPASSGWPCTKSCLTNSPRLFSGNSTEPSYQRGSPKLRLVKWPKQRHNLPASLKRHNLDIICETEHLVLRSVSRAELKRLTGSRPTRGWGTGSGDVHGRPTHVQCPPGSRGALPPFVGTTYGTW